MTKYHFGEFVSVYGEVHEKQPPTQEQRERDCFFEARYISMFLKIAKKESGYIYDTVGGRYMPIIGSSDTGKDITIMSANGRNRKIKPNEMLLYSEAILDYLPTAA